MDSRLILINLLIKLGVAASAASILGRSVEFKSLLFREERTAITKLLGSDPHAGEVGAFQGANYSATAYYRPQLDCVMFTRDDVPFCRVCQRAIERVIDMYSAPPAPAQ
jgi:hypothetical protein